MWQRSGNGIRPENIRDEEIYLESMSENVVEEELKLLKCSFRNIDLHGNR